MRSTSPVLLLAALGAAACASSSTTTSDAGGAAAAPTWWQDARPIIHGHCVSCHDGQGIGPMPLQTLEQLLPYKVQVREQVASRKMPPWHADPECAAYLHDPSLTALELSTLLGWLDQGAPEGDASKPAALPVVESAALPRVDVTLTANGAYTPAPADDYRCYVLPWPEAQARFVTGFDLLPSSKRLVHHANIYSAKVAQAAGFMAKQAEDATGGYNCPGGGVFSGGADMAVLGAWAPGNAAIQYPAGTGVLVEPGSVVVLEVHYSAPPGDMTADQPVLVFETEEHVAHRALVGAVWDFVNWRDGQMRIPAGGPDVVFTHELDPDALLPLYAPWITSRHLRFYGAAMHMHMVASQGYLNIRNDEGRNECLLAIPRWDFHWQTGYQLQEAKPFELGRDRIYVECHFNNSQENQPFIHGEQRRTQDVFWGERSVDEMCIGVVYFTEE